MGIKRYTSCLLLALLFLLFTASLKAQDAAPSVQDEMYILEIQARLQLFLDEWRNLTSNINYCSYDSIGSVEYRMQQLDAKWLTYSQAQQLDIAQNDSLLEIVGCVQVAKQSAQKSLEEKKAEKQMMDSFKDAEVFLASKETVYRRIEQIADKLALAKPLAPKLEKLKAKEQLLFTEIQTHYEAAKQASKTFPDLQERMKIIEEQYVVLKSVSSKVQTAVYKPWILRIKDYLMGFAAVAIILMFLNMLATRIKAFKQARKSAKELRNLMDNNNDRQYPTI